MILGIGVDIIKVSRFENWVTNTRLAVRFFMSEELDYIYSQKEQAILSFASHYAAKEAYGKALGVGLRGMCLKDIAVTLQNGRPSLNLKGDAKRLFEERGGKSCHVSLSHERDESIALVIIEG